MAITADGVKSLVKAGYECHVESGSGEASFISDDQYRTAGAHISANKAELLSSGDVYIKVNPPSADEIKMMKEGSALISFMYAFSNIDLVQGLMNRKISSFSMDAVPRTTKAQRMDALSSQASLGGYKAVKDLEVAESIYEKLLNIKSYKREEVASEHVITSFFQSGPNKVELLVATNEQSAIHKYIEKKGEGIHHVAFAVDDIYAEMERLRSDGFVLLNEQPKKGADNKLVCFVHPKGTNGVLLELCQEIK